MFDVIIPAFNAEASVGYAVDSAIQSGASHVYVVDDGSSDATAIVAARAGAQVIAQSNGGASSARIRGAKVSDAELVIFLDADDKLISRGVATSINMMRKDTTLAAAGGAILGKLPTGRLRKLPRAYTGIFGPAEIITTGFGPWPPGAAVVRRSTFLRSLDLPIDKVTTKYAEDMEMFLRISTLGSMVSHSEASLSYTMHEGKSSQNYLAPLIDKELIRSAYAKHLNVEYDPMAFEHVVSSAMFRAARKKAAAGAYTSAALYCIKGLAVNPVGVTRRLVNKAL